jgi:hypothetical protein
LFHKDFLGVPLPTGSEGDLVNPERPSVVELSNLSPQEKVVGSFVFLRFLIPGIIKLTAGMTSPEGAGIETEKITPDIRRGLVLCGKMLASLCNDVEFGHKDSALIPCNEFLVPYRQTMKNFLKECCEDNSTLIGSGDILSLVCPASDDSLCVRLGESPATTHAKETKASNESIGKLTKKKTKSLRSILDVGKKKSPEEGGETMKSLRSVDDLKSLKDSMGGKKDKGKSKSFSLFNLTSTEDDECPKQTTTERELKEMFNVIFGTLELLDKSFQDYQKSLPPEQQQKFEQKYSSFKEQLTTYTNNQ